MSIGKGDVDQAICKGAHRDPLVYTCLYRGCQIYSQSAISKTTSLTYYLQYTRILRHCIHPCEVLSTPNSHSYTIVGDVSAKGSMAFIFEVGLDSVRGSSGDFVFYISYMEKCNHPMIFSFLLRCPDNFPRGVSHM